MGNFYTDVIQKSALFHSTEICASIAMLEPSMMLPKVQAILADARAAGKHMAVFETYRSAERQEMLFEQGKTELKTVGVHHYGLACDIVYIVNGQPSWDGDFDYLGHLAVKHGLIWGGDWGAPNAAHTFRDDDHVQLIHVDQQVKLFDGSWYPSKDAG